MVKYSSTLYLEINNINFIFSIEKKDEQNKTEILNDTVVPIEGIKDKRIIDLERVFQIFKENIYLIEKKLGVTFKEIV